MSDTNHAPFNNMETVKECWELFLAESFPDLPPCSIPYVAIEKAFYAGALGVIAMQSCICRKNPKTAISKLVKLNLECSSFLSPAKQAEVNPEARR